ncbi:MAG: ABC transporter ATP-binding protein [Anaerolineae bacterium]|nr:ABC transporter ATP-binding protein [Anaerolineae bacterium]
MIEVENLTKHYGHHTAVDGLTFTADAGEIVGLLGPNGAGKTTTMRMLTGFMPPTSGSARIAGFDIFTDSLEVRKRVGYLPERVPLYPDMTVKGYVTFWAELRGAKQPRQQAERALEMVNLSDRRNTLVRNLSKGMRQRLGLAQALVHDPQVVILDEPTIGIDPQQVIEVRERVRALRQQHTVLFSTHILSEAEQICDRVVIINKGKIVAQGAPNALRQQLQHGVNLYVQISGANSATAGRLLSDLRGVQSVEAQGDGFIVRARQGADVRGDIAQRVVQAGYTLLEMRPVAMTLEEIFLDIVGKGQAS